MPPTSRKARWAAFAAAIFAMLAVGSSRSETVQPREKEIVKVVQPAKVIYRTKVVTKIKTVRQPARPPSGFVTVDDCHSIKPGMRFQDMIYQYGWPAYDEGDTYSGYFDYPIVGNHDKVCSVDIIDHKVSDAPTVR
jgi:hypothetical protein